MRTSAGEALANVDRLEHFMWANIIAGWYYARVGLLTVAHSISTSKLFCIRCQGVTDWRPLRIPIASATARFALSCGLHEISDPESYVASRTMGLLGPVRDLYHFGERVNLWWATFLLDRLLALATGLPPTILEQDRNVST